MATHLDLPVLASTGDAVSPETRHGQATPEEKDHGILEDRLQGFDGCVAIGAPYKMEDNSKGSLRL
jgi:hypothetical protein